MTRHSPTGAKVITMKQYRKCLALMRSAERIFQQLGVVHDRLRELLDVEKDDDNGFTSDAIYLQPKDHVAKSLDYMLTCLNIEVER